MNVKKKILEELEKDLGKPCRSRTTYGKEDLERIKRKVVKEYGASSFPTNTSLLQEYQKMKGKNKRILSLLRTRPVRSLSGVVNISVLTKPYPCPGRCIYCPEKENMPKSYLDGEPAAMRALKNDYHPREQVQKRIEALKRTGHPTDKIELRIVGGTWSFYPEEYKEWFIKECFDACNEKNSETLKEAQEKNEEASHRIVCLSIETRPDYIDEREIRNLRRFGVTMVEMGVQSLSNEILSYVKREHGKEETVRATKLLRDAGFKICYQIMTNLPKSSPEKDLETFRELFDNPSFRPDFLKIYPCLVIKDTPLHELYKEGRHKIYTDEELTELLVRIKRDIIPRYVRIQRLFRDIPVPEIEGGCKTSNLREIIKKRAKEEGWRCKCIRCREVKSKYDPEEELDLFREDYQASEGKEVFLTIENKKRDKLYALLRMRDPSGHLFSSLKDAGIIREIKTYGEQLPFHSKNESSPQHRGLGKKMIKKAEKITKKEFRKDHLAVIAGVGVRKYWREMNYHLKETYMVKDLQKEN